METKIFDKIKGALYGVAVGDALGNPLEFMTKDDIAAKYGTVTEMLGGGWMNLQPGETSDETSLTLAVARGVLTAPTDPVEAVGLEFIAWQKLRPADIGATCDGAIHKAQVLAADPLHPTREDWFEASEFIATENEGMSGGNGALMRSVFPALFYADEAQALSQADQIARMTHEDKLSSLMVAAYTRLVYHFIRTPDSQDCLGYLLEVIEADLKDQLPQQVRPSTWCVDTLNVALYYLLRKQSFEDILISVVNEGEASDATGSVAGSLAGAMLGFSQIPSRWLECLNPLLCKRLDELARQALDAPAGDLAP